MPFFRALGSPGKGVLLVCYFSLALYSSPKGLRAIVAGGPPSGELGASY